MPPQHCVHEVLEVHTPLEYELDDELPHEVWAAAPTTHAAVMMRARTDGSMGVPTGSPE